MSLNLPRDLESKLDEYRRHRKDETGKRPFRDTAIVELLRTALEGFVPQQPLSDRIAKIEDRLDLIESDLGQ